jgi:hypothetical protein
MSLENHHANDIIVDIPGHANLQSALNELFAEEPDVNLYNSVNYAEIGQEIKSVHLTWNVIQGKVSYFFLEGVGQLDSNIRGYTFQNQNIISDKTYNLKYGNDYIEKNVSSNIYFRNKIYWGTSTKKELSNEEIISLDAEYYINTNQTRILNPNNEYMYFALPERNLENKFKFNGILNSAWELNKIFLINEHNHMEPYLVYRSTFLQNGHDILIEIF